MNNVLTKLQNEGVSLNLLDCLPRLSEDFNDELTCVPVITLDDNATDLNGWGVIKSFGENGLCQEFIAVHPSFGEVVASFAVVKHAKVLYGSSTEGLNDFAKTYADYFKVVDAYDFD